MSRKTTRASATLRLVCLSLPLTIATRVWGELGDSSKVDGAAGVSPRTYWSTSDAGGCEGIAVDKLLTLKGSLKLAFCRNPQIEESTATIESQRWKLDSAKGAYWPTMSVTASTTRGNGGTYISGFPGSTQNHGVGSASVDAQVNWLLYDFGARASKVADAAAQLDSAIATRNVNGLELVSSVVQAYYSAMAARVAQAASQSSVISATEVARAVELQLTKGLSIRGDLLQAKADLAQAVFENVKAKSALQLAVGALAVQIGLKANSTLSLPEEIKEELTFGSDGRSIDEVINEAVERHPNIRAAAAQLRSAKEALGAVRAGGYGTVSLSGGISRTKQTTEFVGEAITPRSDSVQITLSLPVFEGTVRTAQISDALAKVRYQEAALEASRLAVSADIWKAYYAFESGQEAIAAAQAARAVARENYDKVLAAFEKGDATTLDILQARATLAKAEKQLAQTKADRISSEAQFALVSGRLTSLEQF